ncbi:MAG: peptidoglycan-binding protein [candidate division NC10 bacterium]|nr:peptidoglycan-binding protein [candidate division NC10 bacterium]
MPRTLFARGCRGGIVKKIQQSLSQEGYYAGTLDGLYGGGTERAVSLYQMERTLEPTGKVDDVTWQSLMRMDIPPVQERCLQLTAALEGHGFGMIQGNWDGAWLTWGMIGFTLKHGELSRIVLEIFESNPGAVREAFGNLTDELIRIMRATRAEQQAWANRISEGPKRFKVIEPWRLAFARLGEQEGVQAVQIRHAYKGYLNPALETARRYRLNTEQALALCFDIQVQNGGIGPDARAAVRAALQARPPQDERALRILIANAVADLARPEFREDVRSRKLTIATGNGQVHGEQFELESWGLGEYPWGQG